jgi:hypothetical protein
MEHAILGGTIWTDERGRAVVLLPPFLQGRELEFQYELEAAGGSRAAAELQDGRLTITSAEPHRKVAWRLTYRSAPQRGRQRDFDGDAPS